jgi:hypothetical protein
MLVLLLALLQLVLLRVWLLLLLLPWAAISHQLGCCCHEGLTHRCIIHPQLLQSAL